MSDVGISEGMQWSVLAAPTYHPDDSQEDFLVGKIQHDNEPTLILLVKIGFVLPN